MEEGQIVISTKSVVYENTSILNASHDEDGTWQFLGDDEELSEEDAVVLGLDEIIQIDPTLIEITNLPKGARAFRKNIGSQWIITNDN